MFRKPSNLRLLIDIMMCTLLKDGKNDVWQQTPSHATNTCTSIHAWFLCDWLYINLSLVKHQFEDPIDLPLPVKYSTGGDKYFVSQLVVSHFCCVLWTCIVLCLVLFLYNNAG